MGTFLTGAVFNTFSDALINIVFNPLFIIFLVIMLGYALGRINIKGVSFGSSGVFIIAIIAGIVLFAVADKLTYIKFIEEIGENEGVTRILNRLDFKNLQKAYIELEKNDGIKRAIIEVESVGLTWISGIKAGATIAAVKNIGLALFVTSIGFVAGPSFIRNFKKKATSYITMGVAVVVIGIGLCLLFLAIDKNLDTATALGVMMGGLTSTPGLTAAQEVLPGSKEAIAAASGLAYPFGVLGVVFFIQLMPKILRKDMNVEIEKLKAGINKKAKVVDEILVEESAEMVTLPKKRIILDSLGMCVFGMAVALGMILGAITIPLGSVAKFALGNTGGCLIVGLLFGHFGHIGPVSLEVPKTTLNPLKELGLIFFLAASGIEGGLAFLDNFQPIQLLYGALFTLIPMIAIYFIGRYVFKLELLNNLGSCCGAMTSTPALGALVYVAKTDDVAQSYAAAYPIALFLLVLAPQIVTLIFPM